MKIKRRFAGIGLGICYLAVVAGYLWFGFQPVVVEASEPRLLIESIGLATPVVASEVDGRSLSVPDDIVGEYSENTNKTVLLGHSRTVFRRLSEVEPEDTIVFDGRDYRVSSYAVYAKEAVDMKEILAPSEKPTLVLMTCAGSPLSGDDYTHRVVIEATSE